jgi:hypothetical protein
MMVLARFAGRDATGARCVRRKRDVDVNIESVTRTFVAAADVVAYPTVALSVMGLAMSLAISLCVARPRRQG